MPEHFQEPEKFEPDRFLPERNEGQMYKFIPFGGGVNGCLGLTTNLIKALKSLKWLVQPTYC